MKNIFYIPTCTMAFAFGVVLGLPGTAAQAQSNLVANGSFESGPAGVNQFTAWNWLGPAGNTSDYGVAKSTVSPYVAEQGSNYAYFYGRPTDGSQDCLGTTVNLTPGALYNISYYLGTDGATSGTGAAMWVVIGPSFGIDLSQDIMLTAWFPNSANPLPYQEFSTNYLATNTSTILSFHGIDGTDGLSSTNGILLDNVWMSLTYPPLNLSRSASNQLVFRWPHTNSPYRLQAIVSLNSTNWATLTNVPSNAGTNSQVMLPISAGQQFYRLTLP
jgi:hypothetical protein